MAKAKQAKETSLPVIISLVFFVVTTIGLGVFVYVLYSDQEAKEAEVKKAQDDLKNARKGEIEAQEVALVTRAWAGLVDGDDLKNIGEVKEGSKAFQELKRLNDLAKKRGLETSKAVVDKFNESVAQYFRAIQNGGGAPPKFDVSPIADVDLQIWNAELDDKRQLKPPTRSMLDLTSKAYQFRDLAIHKSTEDTKAYNNVLALIKKTSEAYEKASAEFAKKSIEMPATLKAHMDNLTKQADKWRDDYQKNVAVALRDISTLKDQSEAKDDKTRQLESQIKILKENMLSLQSQLKEGDPFQYDEPKGKITNRPEPGIVEINLGSNANVRPGLTFTVLPRDFPEKGRQSRMRMSRLPDERGVYKSIEIFVPKATIEVTEVLGPDLSRARITHEAADIRDAIMAGDLLYNSVWRRGASDHIALVGIFDTNGDGTDDISTVIRDLNNMGVKVDAYLNLNMKELKWVGSLTDQTRYVVEGYLPTVTANDANSPAKAKLIGAMKTAKDEARARGIHIVSYRDFFGRIGYRARADVPAERINQAAAPYMSGVGAVEAPPSN